MTAACSASPRIKFRSFDGTLNDTISTLYSFIYIKSDHMGRPQLGLFEPGIG